MKIFQVLLVSYHAITLLKKPSSSVNLADMIRLHYIGQDLVALHELLLPWCSLTLISQPKFQDVCHESNRRVSVSHKYFWLSKCVVTYVCRIIV